MINDESWEGKYSLLLDKSYSSLVSRDLQTSKNIYFNSPGLNVQGKTITK